MQENTDWDSPGESQQWDFRQSTQQTLRMEVCGYAHGSDLQTQVLDFTNLPFLKNLLVSFGVL
jgi:hypothetical protein